MSVKSVLKRIFPVPFLKSAFLVYNKIRIRTIDRILFPEFKIARENFLIYRKGYPFLEMHISLDDLPSNKVKNLLQHWYRWTQEEYLLKLDRPCWIEPDYGWGIVTPSRLVYYSLGVSRTWFQPKPALIRFFKRKEVVRLQQAISLRDTGEENYFHFFNDVLTKLYFLKQHQIDVLSIPVIISKKLWDKEYFQFYFRNSDMMKAIKWVIQERQYVRTEGVYFCKPLTHRKDLWELVLSPLNLKSHRFEGDMVFLTRSKSRLRFLENSEQIEEIATLFGFRIVDADLLTPEQQISLLSTTSTLIGLHGAGLTNMVFRRGPCYVLEIFPPPDQGYLPYHYVLLAKMYGFVYRAVIGEPGARRYSGGFRLSPRRFEKALNELTGKS